MYSEIHILFWIHNIWKYTRTVIIISYLTMLCYVMLRYVTLCYVMLSYGMLSYVMLCYIVWLSLIWDTDWLNTVTWLTNISVCCPPRAAEEEHWSIPQNVFTRGNFSRKQMQNGLAILSLQTCMLTALTTHWLFIARTVQWIRVALRRTVQWIRIVLRAT